MIQITSGVICFADAAVMVLLFRMAFSAITLVASNNGRFILLSVAKWRFRKVGPARRGPAAVIYDDVAQCHRRLQRRHGLLQLISVAVIVFQFKPFGWQIAVITGSTSGWRREPNVIESCVFDSFGVLLD